MNRLLSKFWTLVDNEGVGLFQTIAYAIFLPLDAIYNLFFAKLPPVSVEGVLARPFYEIWLYLLLISPIICLVGKQLKGDLTLTGMLLQLVGDLGASIAIGANLIAGVKTTAWGIDGNFGIFIIAMMWVATVIFIMRDVRRLIQVEIVARS